MKVVTTGANGFIGFHTVRELLRRRYHVVAVDIATDKLRNSFEDNKNCAIEQVNILDKDLAHVIEENDKVLHLAAVSRLAPAEQNPAKAIRVNVEGMQNVIHACLEKNAERLVFSSTGGVYSKYARLPIAEDAERDPSSVYGLSKRQAEDWVFLYGRERKLPYIILRYGYIFGQGKDWGAIGNFIKRIRKGDPPIIYGGRQTNDFIYVKDIVEANILALESEYLNQVYNIGTGKATSIKETCNLCVEALNANISPKIEPPRSFDMPMFVYDITKAKLLLKFEPKWSIEEGIRDCIKNW